MFCAISGEVPQEPVVSSKTGHIFEKRLILKALVATGGKCPETNVDLRESDLIPVKTTGTVTRPIPASATSLPGLLSHMQNEWDAIVLETHKLKKALQTAKQELAHALYQYDAARGVIANLIRERDDARRKLAERGVDSKSSRERLGNIGAPLKPSSTGLQPVNGGMRTVQEGEQPEAGGAAEVAKEINTRSGPLPPEIPAKLVEKIEEAHLALRTKRKTRKRSETLANRGDVAKYKFRYAVELGDASEEKNSNREVSALVSAGKFVCVGTSEGSLHVVDTETQSVARSELDAHEGRITSIVASPTNVNLLLTAGSEKRIRLWNRDKFGLPEEGLQARKRKLSSGEPRIGEECVFEVSNLSDSTTGMDFHPCGQLFLSVTRGGWTLHDAVNGETLSSCASDVFYSSTAFHPDGKLFGVGTSAGTLEIWDITMMKRMANLGDEMETKGIISSIAMSENGYSVASCVSEQDIVRIWDLRKQQMAYEYKVESDSGALNASIDLSGVYTAVRGSKGLSIFETKRGRPVVFIPSERSDVSAYDVGPEVTWGKDAKWIAANGRDDVSFYAVPS